MSVFERGWLSSNNIFLHGSGGDATLVDSGHSVHAEQTVALVRQALRAADPPQRLTRVLNTHLHSDHCGGNALLPNATMVIQRREWEAARDAETAA